MLRLRSHAGDLRPRHRLFVSLPWGVSEFEKARAFMGEDYWSHGFEPNRHVLETFTRYHHEQGLSARRVAPEELCARSTLELTRIQERQWKPFRC
jgi:4,5-dihydroxyphthalate decarboxylase